MLGGLTRWVAKAFPRNRTERTITEAERASEFARVREDRRAALNALRIAIDARDTRLQRSTQLAAIQATNAALRGGL